MKNPIFIVGLHRSGSTLWLNTLARHPKIFRIGEMYFLTLWHRDFRYFYSNIVGDLSKDNDVEKMIDLIFSEKMIPGISSSFFQDDILKVNNKNFKNTLQSAIRNSDKSFSSIFKIFIEEITRFKGYNRCCVKFPVDINYIPQLLKWYPQCKIIHITRDPRATAISRTQFKQGPFSTMMKNPVLRFLIVKLRIYFLVFQYVWESKIHMKYNKHKNYALFCYEDLLVNPEEVIKKMCAFAELDYLDIMLSPDPTKNQPSSLTGKIAMGFDKTGAIRWRDVISKFDKTMITLITKKSMKRLGYDPENHPIFL